jgi:hypothetical protein
MLVRVLIERSADENENEEELLETEDLPYGTGQTLAVFDYDPKSQDHGQYLFDLQEALFQLLRHEMTKRENYLLKSEKDKEDGGQE